MRKNKKLYNSKDLKLELALMTEGKEAEQSRLGTE